MDGRREHGVVEFSRSKIILTLVRISYRTMRTFFFSFLFLFTAEAFSLSADEAELKLAYLHKQLSISEDDTRSDSICEAMRQTFIASFEDATVFDHPFKSLTFSTLTSKDHHMRLFNWNLPYRDGSYKYFCFVLLWNQDAKNYTWFELEDALHEPEKIESRYLTADKWLGALYYEIIPMASKGRSDTYTLIGWDGKDNLTTRKIIDALTITGEKIRLGAPLFEYEGDTRKRIVFEYSNEVSASVKYYPKKDCIVMDHLSPKNPMMTGIYADYGPDGTYCLFTLKKGKWKFMDEIDVSQFAEGNDRPFRDPRLNR